MEYPCLLIEFDGDEDDDFDWECIIDARENIFDDCEEGVGVRGLELTEEQEEKVKNHGTFLLPGNHYFVKGEVLVIDGKPKFEFHHKLGGASGKKKAIMIRVVAKDMEPWDSLEDLREGAFGDGSMPTQFGAISYGKFQITPFQGVINGQKIENGVYETKLPFDWPWPFYGGKEDEPVDDVVTCQLAKELGSFWFLRNGIDFVMYCLPKQMNKRFATSITNPTTNKYLTLYNPGECIDAAMQLHEIGHVSYRMKIYASICRKIVFLFNALFLFLSTCFLDIPRRPK